MRTFLLVLLCTGTLIGQQQGSTTAQIAQSKLTWTGYGAIGNYALTGELKIKQGAFTKESSGALKQGVIDFDMPTISHENATLVKHLKSEDFFYVDKFPEASFAIKTITANELQGVLTIRGKTHPIAVPYTLKEKGAQLYLMGTVQVDRTKYDIKYNSSSFFKNLGDQAIKDYFDLAFELVLK